MKIEINYDADYRNGGVYNAVNFTNKALDRIVHKFDFGGKFTLKERAVMVHLARKCGMSHLEDRIVHGTFTREEGCKLRNMVYSAKKDNVPFYTEVFDAYVEGEASLLLSAYGYPYKYDNDWGALSKIEKEFKPGGKHNPEGLCPFICPEPDGIYIVDMKVVDDAVAA